MTGRIKENQILIALLNLKTMKYTRGIYPSESSVGWKAIITNSIFYFSPAIYL
jgi:hypothetical protein